MMERSPPEAMVERSSPEAMMERSPSEAMMERERDIEMDVKSCKSVEDEKVCRICQMSTVLEMNERSSELIMLGCQCKEDLGLAHRHCGEMWFRIKGNRQCEICKRIAENINGTDDMTYMEIISEEIINQQIIGPHEIIAPQEIRNSSRYSWDDMCFARYLYFPRSF
ncbi:hypothetical protein ZOSMA_166G00740 [Zostera marina]|uniref:RING-CH-type domain-containing protein n=1 Tax=Zostera marina TaxID=29655 RepID=A0A0K9PTJ9_ZOSMR|nr:hypothetical protein ZOSMA_166G00740 [Zostera marina]